MIRNTMLKIAGAVAVGAGVLAGPLVASSMAQAPAAPRSSGTVKSASGTGFTLTPATGPDVTITVPGTVKVLLVDAVTKDVKAATAGTLADVAVGDKAIVTGTAGDSATAFTATKVYVLKAASIAQSHAADDAAWNQGIGGLVKSVSADTGTILITSGMKTITVTTTPKTVVRHYSGDSVKFSDATMSTLGAIQPADQLRVRGTKSADGSSMVADEMVAGTFHNYSGLISGIDAAAGTVTLKDLTTKKTVTVAVTANSDVRRISGPMAQMVAAQMRGGAPGAAGAPGAGPGGAGAPGAGAPGAGPGGAGPGGPRGGGPPSGGAGGPDDARRAGRAGANLSQMLSRLPTETLGGLKAGDAVMIVASSASADATKSTAITLLAGVDAILTAQPAGQAATLSPWSLGGGGEGGGEGGPL